MSRFPSGLALLIAGTAFAALTSGAQAASARLWEACKGKDVHAAISACDQTPSGKENPEDQAIALTNRGRAYHAIGQSERALADLTRAIELNANRAAAFSNRSDVYYSKGDYDRAIADATRAIELDPTDAYTFIRRSGAYDGKGDYDRAIADETRAIELEPTVAIFFNARGMSYADKGDYDRAIADFTQAIELDPSFAYALYRRGVAYSKTSKRDLARADIEKALQLDPDDEEARSALAELEQAETAPQQEITGRGVPAPSSSAPDLGLAAQRQKAITDNAEAIFRSRYAFAAGNPDGDVTVVEFFDYNCGFCRRALPEVVKLIKTDHHVRFVFKELPLFGEDLEAAAKDALAAHKQGKYFQMHQKLFSEPGNANKEKVLRVANELGLNVPQLERDMEDASVQEALGESRDLAQKLGLQGTPFYLIGDRIISGAPDDLYEQLTEKVADVRENGTADPTDASQSDALGLDDLSDLDKLD